jgi:hypothetical protein
MLLRDIIKQGSYYFVFCLFLLLGLLSLLFRLILSKQLCAASVAMGRGEGLVNSLRDVKDTSV